MSGARVELIVFCLITFCFEVNATNYITDIEVLSSRDNTRVVFDLSDTAKYRYFRLSSPLRLVIDFNNTSLDTSLETLTDNENRIKKIRLSNPINTSATRIVFELNHEYKINVLPLKQEGSGANKLMVELQKPPFSKLGNTTLPEGYIVAVVAGHGGHDPGSIGAMGSYEKDITLAIANKLVTKLNSQPNMKGIMIRKADYYVSHQNKPILARKNNADLLISIHADAFTSPEPNGASVIVQSIKQVDSGLPYSIATKQRTNPLASQNNNVEYKKNNENLTAKLADLTKAYTVKHSYKLATYLLDELKSVTRLHKPKPEVLNLAVLKAPDIPSVVIETGFLSNITDEKNLITPTYQLKLVHAIFAAINRYFSTSLKKTSVNLASVYRVKPGDSLSSIAMQHGIFVDHLKRANNLHSTTLHINQKIIIPQPE